MKSTFKFFAFLVVSTVLFTACENASVLPLLSSNTDLNARRGDNTGLLASALPQAAIDYIAAKYPGTTITKVENKGTYFEVVLSNLTKLKFDLSGALIEVSGGKGADDPMVSLPAAITTYISTNYPTATIVKAEKNLTNYEVILSNGWKLKFSLDGVFIEGKKKN